MADFEIKFVTKAEGAGARQITDEVKKVADATKEAGTQAAKVTEATNRWTLSKKELIANVKQLKHELSGIPILGQAVALLRNPIALLGAGFAWLAHEIKKTKDEIDALLTPNEENFQERLLGDPEKAANALKTYADAAKAHLGELKSAFDQHLQDIDAAVKGNNELFDAKERLALATNEGESDPVKRAANAARIKDQFAGLRGTGGAQRVAAIDQQIKNLEAGGFGNRGIGELAVATTAGAPQEIVEAARAADYYDKVKKDRLVDLRLFREKMKDVKDPFNLRASQEEETNIRQDIARLDRLTIQNRNIVGAQFPGVSTEAQLNTAVAARQAQAGDEYSNVAGQIVGLRAQRARVSTADASAQRVQGINRATANATGIAQRLETLEKEKADILKDIAQGFHSKEILQALRVIRQEVDELRAGLKDNNLRFKTRNPQ
jgi:hypothetical protein